MVVHNPTARRIPVKKANLKGLLAFGSTNLFPQDLLAVISDSVTASACVSIRAEFIEGNGFRDTSLSQWACGRGGLRMDTVLNRIAWNVAMFEVICLHVTYNMLGQIVGIRLVPVEMFRLAEPDELGNITHGAICPHLTGDYKGQKKQVFTKLPLFNPNPDVVQDQIIEAGGIDKYYGQIIYEPFWTPGDDYYHTPSFISALRAIESEGQLDLYDWNTIVNGFNVSGIIKVLGREKEEHYDPYLDSGSIEYQLSDTQGAQNGAKLFVIRSKNKDDLDATQFIAITGSELADRYNSTNDRTENRITRAFSVANELVGIRRQGGIAPTGDEIVVSSQLQQQRSNRYQRKVSEIIQYCHQHWCPSMRPAVTDFGIQNLNYFPEGQKANEQVAQAG